MPAAGTLWRNGKMLLFFLSPPKYGAVCPLTKRVLVLNRYDSLAIHYQFHESQGNPSTDPLATWHNVSN